MKRREALQGRMDEWKREVCGKEREKEEEKGRRKERDGKKRSDVRK